MPIPGLRTAAHAQDRRHIYTGAPHIHAPVKENQSSQTPVFPRQEGFLSANLETATPPTDPGWGSLMLLTPGTVYLAMTRSHRHRPQFPGLPLDQLSRFQPLAPESFACAPDQQKHKQGTQFGDQDLAELCLLPN